LATHHDETLSESLPRPGPVRISQWEIRGAASNWRSTAPRPRTAIDWAACNGVLATTPTYRGSPSRAGAGGEYGHEFGACRQVMHITDDACQLEGKLDYSIAAETREAAHKKPPAWIQPCKLLLVGGFSLSR
jgi:hypothetical protein